MPTVRDRLEDAQDAVEDALLRDDTLLKRAHRRHKAKRDHAKHQLDRALDLMLAADKARVNKKPRRGARLDKQAQEATAAAFKAERQAMWWLGRIKTLNQRIHKLETRAEAIEQRIEDLPDRREVTISVERNEVRGGTARQRVKIAAMLSASRCASGKRLNYYSQPGIYTANECFTGEDLSPLERSDCSQWFASIYKAAGLPDPNGTDYGWGYTGTLIENGREIERHELKPGDAIIYGTGTGFHVEMFIGEPGMETIGHGSAPIDAGIIDMASPRRYFTYID